MPYGPESDICDSGLTWLLWCCIITQKQLCYVLLFLGGGVGEEEECHAPRHRIYRVDLWFVDFFCLTLHVKCYIKMLLKCYMKLAHTRYQLIPDKLHGNPNSPALSQLLTPLTLGLPKEQLSLYKEWIVGTTFTYKKKLKRVYST